MRKATISFLCLLAAASAFAKQISEQEALEKAQQFMQGKQFKADRQLVRSKQPTQTFKNLYVFNAEANGGFVIVSGDDRTQSILGYADHGEVSPETMPCNMRWLLSYYEQAIVRLDTDGNAAKSQNTTRSSTDKQEIATIINTQWGQGDPYNALCPVYDGQRCITGCAATAMAQVINHHRWPQDNTAVVPSYVSASNHISMTELPQTQFDWDNMSNTAIARLMLYCGQAVQMDYGVDASGAYDADVAPALSKVFGYSKSTSFISRDSYSDEEWDGMVYEELSQGMPILYFGQSSDAGGHAFIVDGYANGMYHLNWGWEGYCDGYFTLDNLNPNMPNGFNHSQGMVVNACPPADAGNISRPKAIIKDITCSERYLERSGIDTAFPAFTVIATVESDLSTDATLQIGFALYDDNGLVKILSEETHDFTPTDSYASEAQITLDASLPQGEYRIVAVSRGNDAEDWLTDAGTVTRYVAVSIGETSMQLQPMPKSEDVQEYIEFGVHTIDGITYKLYSEYGNNRADVLPYNETEKYKGDIYVPDNVSYQNMVFQIYSAWNTFCDSPDLTSLSILPQNGWALEIRNCPELTKIELREGTLKANSIVGCDRLESITFPQSCNELYAPSSCKSLKSITFQNKYTFKINPTETIFNQESLPELKDIFLAGDIPPTLVSYDTNIEVNQNIAIHIPQGTVEAYRRSDWKGWNLVEDQPTIPINVKWDYCGNDENAGFGIVIGNGDDDVEFAMRIPAEQIAAYKDRQITAIEFYTPSPSSNDYQFENVEYVFIANRNTDYMVKQAVNTIRGTWMRVELSQPLTITGEELFVGIGRHYALGSWWANLDIAEDGLWLRVMGNDLGGYPPDEWIKLSDCNHPLPIRAIIEGENLPTDVVMVQSEQTDEYNMQQARAKSVAEPTPPQAKSYDPQNSDRYFSYTIDSNGKCHAAQPVAPAAKASMKAASGKKQIRLKLRNRTPRIVRQVKLDWDIDGNKQEPYTVETVMLTNHEDIVYINLPDNMTGRNHDVHFNVSEVDGEPDAIQANSSVETAFTTEATTYFPRKIVMEEATGTWCGWCPRGIVCIENMTERYPDNFIAIAIHNDEMTPALDSYQPFFNMVDNYPNAQINRSYWIDPFPFDIEDMKDRGEAMIKAEAEFIQGNKIDVSTETTFGFSDDGSTEYRIAYVVTEDKVGPYYQVNSYSNPDTEDNPDDIMNWWVHQEPYLETTFNDVARAIYDYDGIAGQLPKVITEGETYNCQYTITLPDNIENAENLSIVTLLLDTRTGEIMNADRTAITGDPTVGIKDVTDNAGKTFDVYNITGIKVRSNATTLNGLPKGIYIVNGEKVIVR